MSVLLCPCCENVYDPQLICLDVDAICPSIDCGCSLIEVPIEMVSIYIALETKGYHILSCGVAHPYGAPLTNIRFGDDVTTLPTIPKGFESTQSEPDAGIGIHKLHKCGMGADTEAHKDILLAVITLLDWVDTLPPRCE